MPFSDLLTVLKSKMKTDWQAHWNQSLARKGSWYAKINPKIGKPWFTLSQSYKNRKFYTTLCRLRFGHCRNNFHLHRMRIITSPLCSHCSTNSLQTLNHIFFDCPTFNIQRLSLSAKLLNEYSNPQNIPRCIQDLLSNQNIYDHLFHYIRDSISDI